MSEDSSAKEEKKETPAKEEKKETPAKEEEEPKPREYSKEEIEEINKRVEQPSNKMPSYIPEHILSPEYSGTSNYEVAIKQVKEEIEDKLQKLRKDSNANKQEIELAEEDLKKLDHLFENYFLGMNVFRNAHGGRAKLRE